MNTTRSHPLVGRLVQFFHPEDRTLRCGIVRAVAVSGRGRCRAIDALVVQLPAREASNVSATCCGDRLRVSLRDVRGSVNRRRAWPNQVEPFGKELLKP